MNFTEAQAQVAAGIRDPLTPNPDRSRRLARKRGAQ